jgi:hypothetical protein
VRGVAPDAAPDGDQWNPGEAPSQAVEWAVEVLAKARDTGGDRYLFRPSKFLSARQLHHRKYLPHLIVVVHSRVMDPIEVLHRRNQPMANVIDAY